MEKKNKWKIAFWISIVVLVFTAYFSTRPVIFMTPALTCFDYEIERNFLITIINNTDLSKNEIANELNKLILQHKVPMPINRASQDTLYLMWLKLIFENDKLQKIIEN